MGDRDEFVIQFYGARRASCEVYGSEVQVRAESMSEALTAGLIRAHLSVLLLQMCAEGERPVAVARVVHPDGKVEWRVLRMGGGDEALRPGADFVVPDGFEAVGLSALREGGAEVA